MRSFALVMTLSVLAIAGCSASPPAGTPTSSVETFVEFARGTWSCDAVQHGESYSLVATIDDDAMRFDLSGLGSVGTTYTVDGDEAVTGDGWRIVPQSGLAPDVGAETEVQVVLPNETWVLSLDRTSASQATVVATTSGGTIEMDCTKG